MSNIYDLIQQKANNHEDPVPADAWDNIKKKKRRRRPVFFWLLSCLVLLGLITGGYFYYHNSGDTVGKKLAAGKDQPAIVSNEFNKNQKSATVPAKPSNDHSIATAQIPTTDNHPAKAGEDLNSHLSSGTITQPVNYAIPGKKTNLLNKKKTGKQKAAFTLNSEEPGLTEDEGHMNVAASSRKKNINNDNEKLKVSTTQADMEEIAAGTGIETEQQQPKEKTAAQKESVMISPADKLPATPPNVSDSAISTPLASKENSLAVADQHKKQENKSKKAGTKHPWFVDLAITPVIPIQQHDDEISYSRTLLQSGSRADFTGKLEGSRIDPSVAFSISVGKEISNRFSASIGLQYVQFKEHLTIAGTQTNTYYKYVVSYVMLDGGPGELIDTISLVQQGNRKFSAINSYRFLSIPVNVQYKFLRQDKWSLAATLGLNVNVYSRYNNEINLNPNALLVNTSQTLPSTNGVSCALATGLRFERSVSKSVSVFGSPSFSYMLGSQPVKNSLLNTKIHQFNIGLGISYRF